MNYCMKCGLELRETDVFCPNCGMRQMDDQTAHAQVLGVLPSQPQPTVVEIGTKKQPNLPKKPKTLEEREIVSAGICLLVAVAGLFSCMLPECLLPHFGNGIACASGMVPIIIGIVVLLVGAYNIIENYVVQGVLIVLGVLILIAATIVTVAAMPVPF